MFDKLQEELDQFVAERDWDQFHSPKNLAVDISVEAGELLEHFTWHDMPDELTGVKEEIGDVMMGVMLLAKKLNLDLEECVREKIAKTAKKYPVHLSKGKALKYNKL